VPFNMHQSFATHPEAWTFFTAFYPLINSPNNTKYMNKNCPAKTSNLTNPSKHFRDVSGFSYTSSRGIRKYFYYDDLPPDIKAKRQAALDRMRSLGLTPSDDFAFISSTNPTSHNSSHLHPPTPSTPPHHTTTCTNAPPSMISSNVHQDQDHLPPADMSLASSVTRLGPYYDNNVDDDMASHTSNCLLITTDNPTTTPTSTHKLAHQHSSQSTVSLESTQPTYIQFNTLLDSTPNGISHQLNNALTSASIPPGSISPTIKFWAFPSIKIHDKKIAFLTIHDPSLSMCIISVIRLAIPYSLPTTTDILPHPPTITNIDATPYSTSFPLNCRIKTCPFYNGGASIFNNNPNGLSIPQLHRTSLHHNLLTTLPTHILTSIGWAHCHANCHYFSLSSIDLD
jgi:hypothetical protein